MHRPPLTPSPRRYPWCSFLLERIRPKERSAAAKIESMRNPIDPIVNRKGKLPACNFVPKPISPTGIPDTINLLKSSVCVSLGITIKILPSAHTMYLCVLCESQNKQRLLPYTTLTDWFLKPRLSVSLRGTH